MSDIKCADPTCVAMYKGHKWGKIRASSAGWFFFKSGKALCPEHNPIKKRDNE